MQKIYKNIFLILFFGHITFINYLSSENELNQITKNENQEIFQYKVKEHLKPKSLYGISEKQIDEHWKLYKGYVEQVNKLNNELNKLRHEGKGSTLDYSDRRRRYGFEYNGMVLHEYYFENLKKSKKNKPSVELISSIKKSFGSYENWLNDFKQAGKTRGIGWAILCADPVNSDNLINIFVQDHENGNIASYKLILVMDVWEHAYMVDWGATERPNYIDAFIDNVNWEIVNRRFIKN